VLQLVRAGDAGTSEDQYLDVITRKTAILFAAGCYGAAAISNCAEPQRRSLQRFGLNLGIAFQIIDDVLDYEGAPETMGKNVGDDLTEGKPTLPLIHTLRSGTDSERSLVTRAITEKSADQIEAVLAAVRRSGALDYSRDRARQFHDLALAELHQLPDSTARAALQRIADLAIHRDH
jgi:octaprenyl-diphosphate synthase